jgi:16S rRNA (guanine527-N7)-methyltransferase
LPELDTATARSWLQAGLAELGLALSTEQVGALATYLALLLRWNRSYNLTAVREPQQMVVRHLLDSLAIVPHLPPGDILDVGSGAGLPGIPLAVALPERALTLVDSNGKKTRFLFQVKTTLGLDTMAIHQGRVENWRPEQCFDVITSRAFAALPDMARSCGHLLRPGGRFLAMKGQRPDDEMAACEGICRVLAITELRVPGLDGQRHLVEMELV